MKEIIKIKETGNVPEGAKYLFSKTVSEDTGRTRRQVSEGIFITSERTLIIFEDVVYHYYEIEAPTTEAGKCGIG